MDNLELCKVGEEYGCEYQDKNKNMVTTESFQALSKLPKTVVRNKGKYPSTIS